MREWAAEDEDLAPLRERAGLAAVTVAVIADVHGNAWALDAVLADARERGADTFLDLGDTLDGPLDPVGTADRLLALGALTVRGNHDRMMVERRPATAHALLRPEHRDWLAALPAIAEHEDIVLSTARRTTTCTMLLDDDGPGRARASARSPRSRRCSTGSTRR